jgi:hypothetical protein
VLSDPVTISFKAGLLRTIKYAPAAPSLSAKGTALTTTPTTRTTTGNSFTTNSVTVVTAGSSTSGARPRAPTAR